MLRSVGRIGACLAFVVVVVVVIVVVVTTADQGSVSHAVNCSATSEECDKTKCPGPLMHYESLNCVPVYEKEGDCCAEAYNCDHLKKRAWDKCYVNGNVYENGQQLKVEDANPCDSECVCRTGTDGIGRFECTTVNCGFAVDKPSCYRKRSPEKCCPGQQVCPEENPDDPTYLPPTVPTCNVNGTIYKDGDFFDAPNEPDLICTCQEGYQGMNVKPFCKRRGRPYCLPDFSNANDVYNNCTPVYYFQHSPQINCNAFWRCQNKEDKIIRKENSTTSADDDKYVCHFGNMTMYRGDELNQRTNYSSVCVRCVCEVPPVPTCQRLSYNECDLTNHTTFL